MSEFDLYTRHILTSNVYPCAVKVNPFTRGSDVPPQYWAQMYDVILLGRRGDGPHTLGYIVQAVVATALVLKGFISSYLPARP